MSVRTDTVGEHQDEEEDGEWDVVSVEEAQDACVLPAPATGVRAEWMLITNGPASLPDLLCVTSVQDLDPDTEGLVVKQEHQERQRQPWLIVAPHAVQGRTVWLQMQYSYWGRKLAKMAVHHAATALWNRNKLPVIMYILRMISMDSIYYYHAVKWLALLMWTLMM